MVGEIYEIKNKVIEQVMKDLKDKGADRIDPEMVDMIKDLAEAEKSCWEAEYYRAVAEGMDASGYTPMGGYPMGYQGQGTQGGSMGYRQSGSGSANQYGGYGGRSGYSGYHDQIDGLRMAMEAADPTRKEEMRREMRKLMED